GFEAMGLTTGLRGDPLGKINPNTEAPR
ncbi:MAG: hypothetical protein QOE27_2476, partial [Solirubrobacteraceae bacterium]|nr:hypothetical protein [Solirubrobacteraceae bacterium]